MSSLVPCKLLTYQDVPKEKNQNIFQQGFYLVVTFLNISSCHYFVPKQTYQVVPELSFVFLPVRWKNYFAQLEVAQLSFFLTLFKLKFFFKPRISLPSFQQKQWIKGRMCSHLYIYSCKKSLLAPTTCERAGEISIQKKERSCKMNTAGFIQRFSI